MNFLAHAFLSFENPDIMVGNFIADFVKGNDYRDYPDAIRDGILLHREIDQFTDQHHQVKVSKKRLYEQFSHYAGVIVDMYYDHFLAANFFKYQKDPLKQFSGELYRTVDTYPGEIPEKAKRILYYMSKGDWLSSYASIAGIEQAMVGMSQRTRFESGLERAGEALRKDYREYYQDFMIFFPEVIRFVKHEAR